MCRLPAIWKCQMKTISLPQSYVMSVNVPATRKTAITKTTRRRQVAGFSLLELLVVLAVITTLATLIFPVLSSSRRQAQEKTCVANLQQISHALSIYTDDYDGVFPLNIDGTVYNQRTATGAHTWSMLLTSYLQGNLFPTCPRREWPIHLNDSGKSLSDFSGYAFNAYLNTKIGGREQYIQDGTKEAIVFYPACTITLLDVRTSIYTALCPDLVRSWEELKIHYGYRIDRKHFDAFVQQTPGAVRHHGGANYAFADGHVKWLKPEQIRTGSKNDGVHPGFGL